MATAFTCVHQMKFRNSLSLQIHGEQMNGKGDNNVVLEPMKLATNAVACGADLCSSKILLASKSLGHLLVSFLV